jgi:putative FmdB family regulatory protein
LRAGDAGSRSEVRTTIGRVAIYEYSCRGCGQRFEELVGPHVGKPADDVRCPACGGEDLERLVSGYASLHRQQTPAERRRLEERRRVDRAARKSGFKRRRAAARARERGS